MIRRILDAGLEVQMAKIDDLRAASVEAAAELKRLDDAIERAKLDIGMVIVAGKDADNSKLTSLLEKRAEIEMRLSALGKQIRNGV